MIALLDFISAVQLLLNTQQKFTLHLNTKNEDTCTYKKENKTNTTYNMWFQQISIPTPTTEDFLICTPLPPRIFRSRGSLMTPLPSGISRISLLML